MRYGTETRLTSEERLDRAREFFGVSGELGLPEVSTHTGSVTFCDGTGFINIHADNIDRRTEVTILACEYNSWARRFIRELH